MPNETRRGVPYLLVLLLLLIALAGGAAAGILGYIWITGGSGEASLSVEDALATLEASEDTVADAVGTAMVNVANTVIADAVAVGSRRCCRYECRSGDGSPRAGKHAT